MTGKTHVWFWIIAIFVAVLASPIIFSPWMINNRVQKDIEMLNTAFGTKKTDEMVATANGMYKAMFVETNLVGNFKRSYTTQEDMDNARLFLGVNIVANMTNHYLVGFSANIYSFAIRFLTIWAWIPLILPFMVACFCDGYTGRQIKLSTFQFNSPISYSAGMHMTIAGIFLPLIFLVIPFPVSPWVIPAWALMQGGFFILMIRNMQRVKSSAV